MPPPCIYINGFPGVGKLTVAKELQRLLPHSKIFHNHLTIDPVAAILDRTSPEYDTMRTELRQYLLDKIATSESNRDTTWIFTDSRCTSEIGSAAARDYEKTAEKLGAPFVSVIMTCDDKVNMERVVSRDEPSTKLRDGEVLRSIREQEEIFRFGGELELELDVSYLTPEEAARRISRHVLKVMNTLKHAFQVTNVLRHPRPEFYGIWIRMALGEY
jgi:adenylate kinase